MRHRLGAEGSVAEADHAVADSDVADVIADFYDSTNEFLPEQAFLEQTHCPEDVPEVEPDGVDGNPDLIGGQHASYLGLHTQLVERSSLVGVEQPSGLFGQFEAGGPDQIASSD